MLSLSHRPIPRRIRIRISWRPSFSWGLPSCRTSSWASSPLRTPRIRSPTRACSSCSRRILCRRRPWLWCGLVCISSFLWKRAWASKKGEKKKGLCWGKVIEVFGIFFFLLCLVCFVVKGMLFFFLLFSISFYRRKAGHCYYDNFFSPSLIVYFYC